MLSFQLHYVLGVDSDCNRNEYQEYFLGSKGGQSGLITLTLSCADCHEIWEPQPPGTLWACPGLSRNCFTFIKAAKTLHYNSKILNSNNKMKATWNFVKSATDRNLSNNGIHLLNIEGK